MDLSKSVPAPAQSISDLYWQLTVSLQTLVNLSGRVAVRFDEYWTPVAHFPIRVHEVLGHATQVHGAIEP